MPSEHPVKGPAEQRVAIVVIGRNEGARLVRCLASVAGAGRLVVYVDSGSIDGSCEAAATSGAAVVQLDMANHFTAARARNAGFRKAVEIAPKITHVQFVDGDCELFRDWIETATAVLAERPDAAIVCGRLKERHPENSIYNRLCDVEWNIPTGDVKACGGIAMVRASAFAQAGGFRDDLIAGEEPELCVRLRQRGWAIVSVAAPMALHDAAMTRFSQWWKRTTRCGYAYAAGRHIHGASPERHYVRETRRAAGWGLLLPLVTAALCGFVGPLGLAMLAAYPAQVVRLYLKAKSEPEAFAVAASNVVGKFPEALGVLKFHIDVALRRPGRLLEHK